MSFKKIAEGPDEVVYALETPYGTLIKIKTHAGIGGNRISYLMAPPTDTKSKPPS